jgi:hypothetical protein
MLFDAIVTFHESWSGMEVGAWDHAERWTGLHAWYAKIGDEGRFVVGQGTLTNVYWESDYGVRVALSRLGWDTRYDFHCSGSEVGEQSVGLSMSTYDCRRM